jgi:Protein of unknown function (DUF4239)
MTYFAAALTVLVCAVITAILSYLASRFVSLQTRRQHHEVGSQVFQLIGVLFAVILAFVFNEVWSQYNTAAQAISAEGGALHGAAMLANALPNHEGRPINEAMLAYSHEVAEVEWPTMARERRSVEAAHDLRSVIDVAARLQLTRPGEITVQSQILALLAEAHAHRETRTFQLGLGLPVVVWAVLIIFSVFLMVFVVLAGVEPPGSIVFACSFAALIVSVLVIVRMLDYPFEGALALSSEDFVKLSSQLTAMLASR